MVTRPRNLQQADPYFDSVTLLVPFSGEDAATAATDLSNSGHTLTFNGNAALDSDIRKFGFSSCYFDGTGDYISIPDSTALSPESGSFTVEAHVRFNGTPATTAQMTWASKWNNGFGDAGVQKEWWIGLWDSGHSGTPAIQVFLSTNGSNGIFLADLTWSPSGDTWYHIAVVFDRDLPTHETRVYIDGTQLGSSNTTLNTYSSFFNSSSQFWAGRYDVSPNGELDGWVENLRITKGVARYTGSSFTPPERAYPTVQNVDGIFQLPDTSTITYDSISSSLSAAGYIVDFVWNDDGTQYIFTSDGNGGAAVGWINYASCSTPYDVTTLSTTETVIDTTTGRGRGIQWNNDGTKIYTTDYSANPNFHEWNVSPAYDITSISLTPDQSVLVSGPGNNMLGLHFTDDGKYVIFGTITSTAWLYPLSTAWDISTLGTGQSANLSASGVTRSDQLIISNDGTRIWQLGLNTEKIHQWTLTTPFDLSTASWDGAGKDFALQDSGSYVNVTGMTIHPTNRNELYVTWTLSSYRIQKYTIG